MDPSARIISHMNDDHHIAVVDYLVVYGKVPLSDLVEESVKISEVNVKTLTISYDLKTAKGKQAVLVWNDLIEDEHLTVSEMRDIKSKLIAMAKYAAGKQGYSHVVVKAYPKITQATRAMVVVFLFTLIGSYDLDLLKLIFQNDVITSKILTFLPDGVFKFLEFVGDRIKVIFFTTYLIHLFEVIFFTVPRVIKYRVPFPQSLLWCLDNFIEGYLTIQKFDKSARQ